jgi:hypothetical protein
MRTSLASSFAFHAGSLALPLLVSLCCSLGCSSKDTVPAAQGCEKQLGSTQFNKSTSCSSMCAPTNGEYCSASVSKPKCTDTTRTIDSCGVNLALPTLGTKVVELKRSANLNEFSGSGPVDVGCFAPAGYPPPADTAKSQTVTMKGIAKIFSHGCESNDVTIEVHKVVRSGGEDDGKPGELVGKAVTTASSCKGSKSTKEDEKCGTAYQCEFSYPGVPTETELMVVTDGTNWAPIYEYGLFISNSEVKNGEYEKDVRALAQDDYTLIPQVGIGKLVTPGSGVLAGEVHDCGNVRLSGAVVDVDKPRYALMYFTDNESNPTPDGTARHSSVLGLYSAFEIKPGPVTVAAAGVKEGKLVSLGYFRAQVFPDAVSTYTFRGLRPFQVPKK